MHSGSTPNLLWTPDGRRLIALLDGQVVVHDTKTGLSRRSEAALPKLLQLALRPVS